MVDYQEQYGFPLVNFDSPHDRYLRALESVATAHGLRPPEGGFRFFTNELRRNSAPPETELPHEVMTLFERLQDIAE